MSKKIIRIFCLPSHTMTDRVSGVDYLRITQPMKYLNGYKNGEYEFEVFNYDPRKDDSFDWRDIFRLYDIVYFNYTTNDIGYAVMGLMAQKNRKKLVCDLDDNLWDILSDNGAYDIFKKGEKGLKVVTAILNDVHYVTCTNQYLKNVIAHNTYKPHDKIQVFPNYIDLDLYKHRVEFKDRGQYLGLHFGSSTHFTSLANDDFIKGMDRVMKDYPNFTFLTIGSFFPRYKQRWGRRYRQGFGDTDLLKWIEKMPLFVDEADFMIVPLIVNTYNRAKSSCKYLEASSTKLPGVYQNIRQYEEIIKNGVNGFLATTESDWYDKITKLINDAKLRKEMGEKAFETTKKWQIQDKVKEYADFFIKVLTE